MPDVSPTSDAAAKAAEAALVERLRHGDPSAFERLVRDFAPRLLVVARRMLSNEEDALDALQDALLSAHKAIDRFEGGSALYTWLHRITINASLMKLRKRRSRHERSIEDILPRFNDDGHRANPGPAWKQTSEDELIDDETRAVVRQKIDELPDIYRTVLLLRDIEGLNTDETADLLDVNAGVIKTRLHRARMALRELLDPYFSGDRE